MLLCWLALSQTPTELLGGERLSPPEDVVFRSALDGSQQRYVLVRPSNWRQQRGISVLIALHGHGADRWQFIRQQRDECRAVRSCAARHGLLLVAPDYRAKTSWMGPAAEADVAQIIESLKAEYPVERVLLCGASMGGAGALTFAARRPELVDGVVSLNGTADLVHYQRFGDAIAASFGGDRQTAPEQYRQRSALWFPERLTMPLAATTGGRDDVVPPESVLELLAKVRRLQPDTLQIHRPEGGHQTNYEDATRALEFVVQRSRHRVISNAQGFDGKNMLCPGFIELRNHAHRKILQQHGRANDEALHRLR